MTVEEKRQAVIAAYPKSESWERRVKAMSNAQVVAIYIRFRNEKKI